MNHYPVNQDIYLTFSEVITTCNCEPESLVSLVEESAISIDGEPQQAQYSGYQLAQIRRALRIRRDFEASAPATALILELLEELQRLRRLER